MKKFSNIDCFLQLLQLRFIYLLDFIKFITTHFILQLIKILENHEIHFLMSVVCKLIIATSKPRPAQNFATFPIAAY